MAPWRHGLDLFQWISCMAQIFRRKARMEHRNLDKPQAGRFFKHSNAILKLLSQKGKWKPCKTAQSLGCSLQFKLLNQSCHTMGESFLDQRFDLLPDVCLVARALGHPITGLNSAHIRQCLQLHYFIPNSGAFDRQLPLSDSIHMYSRCRPCEQMLRV